MNECILQMNFFYCNLIGETCEKRYAWEGYDLLYKKIMGLFDVGSFYHRDTGIYMFEEWIQCENWQFYANVSTVYILDIKRAWRPPKSGL